MPSFGLAHPRAKFRFDRLSPTALARIARFPSYRAPRAADLHDPTTFQPPTGPADAGVMTGRDFITRGTTRDSVRLVAVQPYTAELAACPHLATLRRLDLTCNHIGLDGARALAGSPHLGGLKELGLNGNTLGPEGASGLAGAPWLAGLERLEVAENGLTAADLERLLERVPNLTGLDVSRNPLGGFTAWFTRPGLRVVAAACVRCDAVGSPDIPAGPPLELEALDLRHNALAPDALAALLRRTPRLARLDLGFTDCGDDGAAALAAVLLPRLANLGLRATRLTPAGAVTIARSSGLADVTDLDVSVNPLGDDGSGALLAGFPNLTRLDLANAGLTDAGVARLLALPGVGRIRHLSLAWNPCGDAAVAAFAAGPAVVGLGSLDMTGTRITRAGLAALTRAGVRPELAHQADAAPSTISAAVIR
jgi:hypothetical protein